MKLVYAFLMFLLSSVAYSQSTTVVISQVYGGGSNTGATFNADFVELHNVSNTPQDISGFKILYGSATGNLATSTANAYTLPASGVIIPAGGYLLIAASAGTVGSALPTPDYNFALTMAGASGKIAFGTSAMVNNTNLAGQPAGSVIDFVGYGTANESETSPTGVLSATLAAIRNTNGCTETNNNLSDFTVAIPNPRNSASAVAICGVTPLPPTISVTTPLTAFGNVCINTTAGPNSFAISGSNLTAGNLTVGPLTGYTFSLLPAGPYASTLTLPQTGGAYATFINVQFTPTAVQSYAGNIPVSGGGASAINVAASGFGVDETIVTTGNASSITSSSANVNATLNTGCDALVSYGIEYSANPTFTPGSGTSVASTNLSGTSFSVALSGLTQNTTYYYIAYANTSAGPVYGLVSSFTTGIISTGGAGVVISQVYGGGGSATGTFNADYVELHNNTLAAQNISGCKIMYGSSTGNLGSFSGAIFTFPSGSIIPSGGYVLVATTAGTGLAPIPVTADYTFTLTLSGTNGKVVFGSSSLLANTTLASQPAGTVFDFVGYGSANESETAPVG
ncbi:MAG: lamin tail domain-containing protein, partial [Ferruginibacter sp.]